MQSSEFFLSISAAVWQDQIIFVSMVTNYKSKTKCPSFVGIFINFSLTIVLYLVHRPVVFLFSFMYLSKYCPETCGNPSFSAFWTTTFDDLDLHIQITSLIGEWLSWTDSLISIHRLDVFYNDLSCTYPNIVPKHVKIQVLCILYFYIWWPWFLHLFFHPFE